MLRSYIPQPQWLFFRALALISAHFITKIAPTLQGWQRWLAYAVAAILLGWALWSLIDLARRRWRR